jgi:hypothetical protein
MVIVTYKIANIVAIQRLVLETRSVVGWANNIMDWPEPIPQFDF